MNSEGEVERERPSPEGRREALTTWVKVGGERPRLKEPEQQECLVETHHSERRSEAVLDYECDGINDARREVHRTFDASGRIVAECSEDTLDLHSHAFRAATLVLMGLSFKLSGETL